MANNKHLEIIKQGAKVWERWRGENPNIIPDLSQAELMDVDLQKADLSNANLEGSDLFEAKLSKANLTRANLSYANLLFADLNGTNLHLATLLDTNLVSANLSGANLFGANFTAANLDGANLTLAKIGWTTFAGNNLRRAKGLDDVVHLGPSSIGVDTIYLSKADVSDVFLRYAGVPEDLIEYVRSRTGQMFQFYSCFISYSHKDEQFAKRLYSQLRDTRIRVWFAPEDIKGGKKLHEQIDRAIQIHDKLLLVLSESSLQSEWVMTEIRSARRVEIEEKRRKLFPIRLVGFEAIRKWKCFDADIGKDLAVEVREYFIPDFSNWKDHDSFEKAFDRLLHDLGAEEPVEGRGVAA